MKRKALYVVGDRVTVFRKAKHWWCPGMGERLIGKEFTITDVSLVDQVATSYMVDGYFVSADCLRRVA
jgi:hypothetical protein